MKKNTWVTGILAGGFIIAILALATFILASLGNRFNFLQTGTIVRLVFISMAAGFAAAAVSAIGLILGFITGGRGGYLYGIAGIVFGLLIAAGPWNLYSKHMPRIHDITTDTQNPPKFVDILALRKDAANKPEYEGAAISAQQEKFYPDIKPLFLTISAGDAFDKALAVSSSMGWKIVASDRDGGRIEATATTFWMGFKDDIVIRVTKSGSGSRVDIRSESRVGVGDFGTNAARIRKFLKEMTK